MPLTIEIRQRTADRPEGAAAYTSSATDTPCCPSGTRIASGCCRVLQSSDANLRSPPPEGIVHVAKPSGQVAAGSVQEERGARRVAAGELGKVFPEQLLLALPPREVGRSAAEAGTEGPQTRNGRHPPNHGGTGGRRASADGFAVRAGALEVQPLEPLSERAA